MRRAVPRRALTAALVLAATAVQAIAAGSPCGVAHPSDRSVAWTCRAIPRGSSLEKMFGAHWQDVARFNRIDRRHATAGTRIRVPANVAQLAGFSPLPATYAAAAGEPRFILVDLAEQYLGAYENGRLVFAAPVTTGGRHNETPPGNYRIDAVDLYHHSSKYQIEKTAEPYPMHYALRFLRTRDGTSYWIHGRDLPGVPDSHGCIGLYDEAMQRQTYGAPASPVLADARRLCEWAVGTLPPGVTVREGLKGPAVRIIGRAPLPGSSSLAPEVASASSERTSRPAASSGAGR